MVLVVALAGIDADEVALDDPLRVARHVVVVARDTVGHADRGVVAVFGTVVALHLW